MPGDRRHRTTGGDDRYYTDAFAAGVREELVSTSAGRVPTLGAGLAQPLRRISVEFRRAAFFLDEITVECRAFLRDNELTFVSRFVNSADKESSATVRLVAS